MSGQTTVSMLDSVSVTAREELERLRKTLDDRLRVLEAALSGGAPGISLESAVLDLARVATEEAEVAAISASADARREASEEIARYKAAAADRLAREQAQAAETKRLLAEHQAKVAELERQLQDAHAVASETRRLLDEERAAIMQVQQQLEAERTASADAHRLIEDIKGEAAASRAGLERDLERERDRSEEARQALAAEQERAAESKRESDARIARLEASTAEAQRLLEKERIEAAVVHRQLQSAQEQAAAAETERERAGQMASDAQSAKDRELAEARAQNEEMRQLLSSVKRIFKGFGAQKIAAENRFRELGEQLRHARAALTNSKAGLAMDSAFVANDDWQPVRLAERFALREFLEIQVNGEAAHLANISVTGCQIVLDTPLQPNQLIRLALPGDAEPIQCTGAVAWAMLEPPAPDRAPRYRAGVEFLSPDEQTLEGFIGRQAQAGILRAARD